MLPELQRYKDTVRCGALGAEVPGHRQQQLMQTLIVCLVKTHFFTPILECEKSTEYNCVSDQTCYPPGALPHPGPLQLLDYGGREREWERPHLPVLRLHLRPRIHSELHHLCAIPHPSGHAETNQPSDKTKPHLRETQEHMQAHGPRQVWSLTRKLILFASFWLKNHQFASMANQ